LVGLFAFFACARRGKILKVAVADQEEPHDKVYNHQLAALPFGISYGNKQTAPARLRSEGHDIIGKQKCPEGG
jgi:hypothetical protein